MPNVPKPELEKGAYIVYTDEPNTVIEPSSSGGSGAIKYYTVDISYDEQTGDKLVSGIDFTFNDVLNGGFAVLHTITSNNIPELYCYCPLASCERWIDGEYVSFSVLFFGPTDDDVYTFESNDPDAIMTYIPV